MKCEKISLKDKNFFNKWMVSLPHTYRPFWEEYAKMCPVSLLYIYFSLVGVVCVTAIMELYVAMIFALFAWLILFFVSGYFSFVGTDKIFLKHFAIRKESIEKWKKLRGLK